jgi:hypothetical protein
MGHSSIGDTRTYRWQGNTIRRFFLFFDSEPEMAYIHNYPGVFKEGRI